MNARNYPNIARIDNANKKGTSIYNNTSSKEQHKSVKLLFTKRYTNDVLEYFNTGQFNNFIKEDNINNNIRPLWNQRELPTIKVFPGKQLSINDQQKLLHHAMSEKDIHIGKPSTAYAPPTQY